MKSDIFKLKEKRMKMEEKMCKKSLNHRENLDAHDANNSITCE